MENRVSVWLGNVQSEEKLEAYLELVYDEEGNVSSVFTEEFGIAYYDEDFQEAYYSDIAMDVRALVEPLSYAESYCEEIKDSPQQYNAIIALYNVDYRLVLDVKSDFAFIGSYEYALTK